MRGKKGSLGPRPSQGFDFSSEKATTRFCVEPWLSKFRCNRIFVRIAKIQIDEFLPPDFLIQ